MHHLLPPAVCRCRLTGAGQPAPQRLIQAYSDEQKAELDKISAYLNSIHTLKGGFLQIGPEGSVDQGDVLYREARPDPL